MASAPAGFAPSALALGRVVEACGDETAAATMLLEWVKAEELRAWVKTYRVAGEDGPITSEKDKLLGAEDWDRFEEIELPAFIGNEKKSTWSLHISAKGIRPGASTWATRRYRPH